MKKIFLFSTLLFLFLCINNRLSAQVEQFFHSTWGLAATGNSRIITNIIEEGDEVYLEGIVAGYFYLGTLEYTLYYDPAVVYPIKGPGGEEITILTNGQNNMGDFLEINKNVTNAVEWRSRTTGLVDPEATNPYVSINTGGVPQNPLSEKYVQAGQLFPIFKVFFKKKAGQNLSSSTFTYYNKLTLPPRRNDFNLGAPLYIQMDGTESASLHVRPHMFSRRIKSDVTTTNNFNVHGTSVTMTGLAEIVNRDILMEPHDMIDNRSGLDWDTILTTGFIYSKNNVPLSIKEHIITYGPPPGYLPLDEWDNTEYIKVLNINGAEHPFPSATEIANGYFTRGTYDTFYIVSTANTARSYEINMVETAGNLAPKTNYYAYAFLLYKFQTSDAYPVMGEQISFSTECNPTIPPSVTSPYIICANPVQYLIDIPVSGTNIKWYSDDALQNLLPPATTQLQDETVYFVTQTVNSCESDPSSVTVFFSEKLYAPNIASPQTFCRNTPTLADIALPAGVTVKWYDAEDGDFLPNTTPMVDGRTYWAALLQGNCESVARTPVTVYLQTKPDGPAITTPQYFCAGALMTTIDVSPYNPAQLSWYEDAAGTTPINDMTTPLVTGSYYVEINLGNSCVSYRTKVDIEINSNNGDFGEAEYEACTDVKLTDIPVSGWGIKWFDDETMQNELDPNDTYPAGIYYAANSFGTCLIPNMAVTVIIHNDVDSPTQNSANNHVCDKSQICPSFVLGLINAQPGFTYKVYTNSTCTSEFTSCITAQYSANPYTFYARAFMADLGCGSDINAPLPISVIVDWLPASPTLSGEETVICEGLTIDQEFLETLVTIPSSIVVFYTNAACTVEFTTEIIADFAETPYTFYALSRNTSTGCFSELPALEIIVDVDEAPIQPTVEATNNGVLCNGSNVMLYVANQDDYTDPTYQWYRNATLLNGATSAYYITSVTGTFTVVVHDVGCDNTSEEYEVTNEGGTFGYNTPVIDVTNGGVLCDEANVMLYLTNANDYPASAGYQWYKNGVPVTSGGTSTYYVTNEPGVYTIEVSVGGCSMVSNNIEVTSITTNSFDYEQPDLAATNGGVICDGANVTLYLTNGDIYEDATYIWYKNGVPISGEENPFLIANASGVYHVEVIIEGCSMVSNGVNVTVSGETFGDETPLIDVTNGGVLCADANVMVYLTNADVYTNPSYLWYHDGVLMIGETNSYILVDEIGSYHVVVTVTPCSMGSNSVEVTSSGEEFDNNRPVIAITNGDEICDGATALLYIENGDLYDDAEYQWYKDGILLDGEENPFLLINAGGTYLVEVITTPCSMMSEGKQVTITPTNFVYPAPVVDATNEGILCDDANVMVYLTNADIYPVAAEYQWYHNGLPMNGETDTYVIVADEGVYHIEVIIDPCSSVSDGVEVTHSGEDFDNDRPVIAITGGGEICDGANALLYIENGDLYEDAEYQWYKDGLPLDDETNPYLLINTGGNYLVEVIITPCSMMSEEEIVTLIPTQFNYATPEIAATNEGDLCDGANVMLYLANIDEYPTSATYQWYYNGALMTGETGSYIVVEEAGAYHIEVIVSPCSSVSENFEVTGTGTVVTIPQPAISRTNEGDLCDGANVMLYITNVDEYGNNVEFQWYKDGLPIDGETNTYLIVDAPGVYRVEVSVDDCSMVSDAHEVTLSPNIFDHEPPLLAVTNGGIICDGANVTLYLSIDEIYEGAIYIWYRDGLPLDGEEDPYLIVDIPGVYHVEVIIGDCSMVSNGVAVTESDQTFDDDPPVIAVTNGGVLCTDANVMVYLTNPEVYINPSYLWYHNGILMTGETNAYIIVEAAGAYHVVVTVASCSMGSNTINVTSSGEEFDNDRPVIAITNGDEICDGATALLYIANGDIYEDAEYQWYKDGLPLDDETNPYLLINTGGIYHVEVSATPCSMMSEGKEVTMTPTHFDYDTPEVAATNEGDLCADANVMLYLANVNTYPTSATYQWYHDGALMTGETNSYLIVEEGGIYHIEVVVSPCSSVSDGFEVTTTTESFDLPQPILDATNDGDLCTGANVMLYITNGDLYEDATYLWYRNGVLLSATTSYLIVNVPGIYFVEVTMGDCSMVSNGKRVNPTGDTFDYPKPEIAATNNGVLCDNSNVMLYVDNIDAYEDAAAAYQWFYEGVLIPAATNNYYVTIHTGVYHVEVSIGDCSITSDTYTVTEGDEFEYLQPIIDVTNDGQLCDDANVMLFLTNGDEYEDVEDISYQWFFNGYPIPDANNSYYITDVPGIYHLSVIIEDCSMVSNAKTVELSGNTFAYEHPEITATYDGVICESRGSIILSIDNGDEYEGTGATYQWFFNGAPINGAEDDSYETDVPGYYHVEVTIGDCSVLSDIYEATYVETCGVTLLGTVFPFVHHTGNIGFSGYFPIQVSLKTFPEITNPGEFDLNDLMTETPKYGPVNAVYYDGTTFIPSTPKISGLGLLSNYGVAIDFLSAIGYPHEVPANPEFLTEGEPAGFENNMTIGFYRFDEVLAGKYILEIKRDGFLIRWAKITVNDKILINYMDHREIVPGDLNEDLTINNDDINDMKEVFNATYSPVNPEAYRPMARYDFDADGRVINDDLNLLIIYAGMNFSHYTDTKAWLDELGIDY
jgi:hypothetical protein